MSFQHPDLSEWLERTEEQHDSFRHTLVREVTEHRPAGLVALKKLAEQAHLDAKQRLERFQRVSLDPLERPPTPLVFPDSLHTSAIQGYLGELLAGISAENFSPHDREWRVPAFLFRGHQAAYQDLERRRQLGGPARPIPGRTGDDALAFEVDDEGTIVGWLWGEAKCSHDHNAGLISDGYKQLSAAFSVPVDLMQLVEILEQRGDEESRQWVSSLRELQYASTSPPRFDLLVYVCGRSPATKKTWIAREQPHEKYEREGPIQAIEIQFGDFDGVLTAIYPEHVVNRA